MHFQNLEFVVIALRKFRLVSADARRGGKRDEALRVSALEAIVSCRRQKEKR